MRKLPIVFNFSTTDNYYWHVINDSVMGGKSSGHTINTRQAFHFYGKISTENNGGFSVAYLKLPKLPKNFNAIKLCLLGKAGVYQLKLKNKIKGNEITYKADFIIPTIQPKNEKIEPTEFSFLLRDFIATHRGKVIKKAPVLTSESISHVGLLVKSSSDKKFTLSLSEIQFL